MNKLSGWCMRGLATMALCFAGGASAADLGFYVVVDGTQTTSHTSRSDFESAVGFGVGAIEGDTISTVRWDSTENRYSMTVGYQLGSYFAVEGTYVDFGKFTYDYVLTKQGGAQQFGRLTMKAKGPTVSAVGFLPLGDYFSLDAHGGFSFLDNKYKLSLEDRSQSFSDSSTGVYYGGGFAWWITGQFAVRAGYNGFTRGLFADHTSQYTVGIRYSYGY